MIPQRRGATDATIARLEVRADRADPMAVRLSAERILGAMEIRPGSLPPPAILCVRELRDPRPGTVSLESRELRPPPAWEQAMQREVERMARTATRPAHGTVPASAEAVVFADEAELLACLGSDLVTGAVAARWWWRLLVEGVDQPRHATIRAWQRAPEHAPAALQVLAERGQAAAFARILDDDEARSLADVITKRFALPTVPPVVVDAARPSPPATAAAARTRAPLTPWTTVAPEAEQVGLSTEPRAVLAPWATIAPEAEQAGLSTEQRALVGVTLTIARAPSLARSTDFVTALARWRIATASPEPPDVAPAPKRTPQIAPAPPRTEPRPTRSPDGNAEISLPSLSDVAPQVEAVAQPAAPVGILPPVTVASDAMPPPIASSASPAGPSPSPLPSPTLEETTTPTTATARVDEEGVLPEPPLTAEPTEPRADVETTRWSAAAPEKLRSLWPRSRAFGPPVATELGGLFYLVNLALYLRLYGDDDNLSLPLWDFVALVGRELLGDTATADDPVWSLLTELAGRADDEPPGAGFVPPADWRLPPAWLSPFDAAPVRHGTSGGRLVITHAEGFLLIDVEAHGDQEAQLARELAPYGNLPCAPGADDAPLPPWTRAPLDRWLARLIPYVRARLRGVLTVDDAGLPALLLAHRARVHVTDTHLDIALSLETLPVELRFAGLDRDPGWVAAAGRFIAFHFE